MGELTQERLAELRRVAEAAQFLMSLGVTSEEVLAKFCATFDPVSVLAMMDEIERLRRECDAAADEAEWWKRRHDALRAAVIKADALIVDAINRATAMYNHTQDANYDSRADGLDEALMILRQLLAEAGGGDQ